MSADCRTSSIRPTETEKGHRLDDPVPGMFWGSVHLTPHAQKDLIVQLLAARHYLQMSPCRHGMAGSDLECAWRSDLARLVISRWARGAWHAYQRDQLTVVLFRTAGLC